MYTFNLHLGNSYEFDRYMKEGRIDAINSIIAGDIDA